VVVEREVEQQVVLVLLHVVVARTTRNE